MVCAFLLVKRMTLPMLVWQYCNKIRLIQSKMKNLKYLSLMLLCAVMSLSFTACSDDDKDVVLTKEAVIGTWDVVWAEQNGESIDVPSGYIYMTLNEDGTYRTMMLGDPYKGTYEIQGNTVVGTTSDPITEYYRFTSLDGNNASISYSNSDGDEYNFRAVKR